MKAYSETTLRRKLNELGYRLWRKNGEYAITAHSHGGLIHASTITPYCLDLDEVNEWYRELAA